jgi:hypothetical protein
MKKSKIMLRVWKFETKYKNGKIKSPAEWIDDCLFMNYNGQLQAGRLDGSDMFEPFDFDYEIYTVIQ